MNEKEITYSLLAQAGVEPNGPHPWDIQIHDERFYRRVLRDSTLGLGESYMDGWWDCPHVDQFITKLLDARLQQKLARNYRLLWDIFIHRLINFQTKHRSKEVAVKHYDLGNELYQSMLDSNMCYSCGYWKRAATLEEAQLDKMELICQKLMLQPGMKLLDIGCGWGGLAKYAAERYGVEVVGITLSQEQKKLADERCRGLPIKILLQDYRDLPPQQFDRIVSVGMFEHVGYKNYRQFMQITANHLKDEGIFLLHTIGSNSTAIRGDYWISKYIFPNGMLPSIQQIGRCTEDLFIMEDWHNIGADYDKTLMAWHENFNRNWPKLQHMYDQRFYRMWNYYLLACAATFRARATQLWQIVLTKYGLKGGFRVRDLCEPSLMIK